MFAVNRAQLAVRVGPFIPDTDFVFLEIGDIGFAFQKPEQLVNNRTQMQLFRRHQRKPCIQIEAHLGTEYRSGAGAGAVGLLRAVFHDMLE